MNHSYLHALKGKPFDLADIEQFVRDTVAKDFGGLLEVADMLPDKSMVKGIVVRHPKDEYFGFQIWFDSVRKIEFPHPGDTGGNWVQDYILGRIGERHGLKTYRDDGVAEPLPLKPADGISTFKQYLYRSHGYDSMVVGRKARDPEGYASNLYDTYITMLGHLPGDIKNIAVGGVLRGREYKVLEPWQMTRAEFHAGKNLHGSRFTPSLGIASKTNAGFFFSTDSESHADFYANSDIRNEVGGEGEIFAVEPPDNPIDFGYPRGRERTKEVYEVFRTEAERLDEDFYEGRTQKSAGLFKRAVSVIKTAMDEHPADRKKITAAFLDAAFEHSKILDRFDVGFLRDTLKKLGYDAFVSEETNQNNPEVSCWVTVYTDKPVLVSHRASVRRALEAGDPVSDEVLADYPDLGKTCAHCMKL